MWKLMFQQHSNKGAACWLLTNTTLWSAQSQGPNLKIKNLQGDIKHASSEEKNIKQKPVESVLLSRLAFSDTVFIQLNITSVIHKKA